MERPVIYSEEQRYEALKAQMYGSAIRQGYCQEEIFEFIDCMELYKNDGFISDNTLEFVFNNVIKAELNNDA